MASAKLCTKRCPRGNQDGTRRHLQLKSSPPHHTSQTSPFLAKATRLVSGYQRVPSRPSSPVENVIFCQGWWLGAREPIVGSRERTNERRLTDVEESFPQTPGLFSPESDNGRLRALALGRTTAALDCNPGGVGMGMPGGSVQAYREVVVRCIAQPEPGGVEILTGGRQARQS